MLEKRNIWDLSEGELQSIVEEWGFPKYRTKQILNWLWKNNASNIDEMSNLPKNLRNNLNEHFTIQNLSLVQYQKSKDGTIKALIKVFDENTVEAVLIPTVNRITVCISSQIGCSLDCKFCATGRMKRIRNLTAREIYGQVLLMDELAMSQYDRAINNVVYMGMGEPLLNYQPVKDSIFYLTEHKGLSTSKITLSTSGIAKSILRMAQDGLKVKLALSLHAPNDQKRAQIMSIGKSNTIADLINAMDEYYKVSKKRMTFEYVLLNGFNDTPKDAAELIELCKKVPVKVNLIEYNRIKGIPYDKTSKIGAQEFVGILEKAGVIAKIRQSRGEDIDAACGQLAGAAQTVQ